MAASCKATSKNGDPCAMPALKGKDYCYIHDPESREQRKRTQKLGGFKRRKTADAVLNLNPDDINLETIDGIRAVLTAALADVRIMENSIRRADAIVRITATAIKLLEAEWKADDITELAARIALLEQPADAADSNRVIELTPRRG